MRAEALGPLDRVPLLVRELAMVEARDASTQCGILEEVLAPLDGGAGHGQQFVGRAFLVGIGRTIS